MTQQKRGATVAPKVLETQHKTEILRKFNKFIASQATPHLANLITSQDAQALVHYWGGGVRLIAQNATEFTEEELDRITCELIDFLHSRSEELFPNRPLANLYDVVIFGIPFLNYLDRKQKNPDALTPMLQAEFGNSETIQEKITDILTELKEFSYMTGKEWSSYSKGFCYIFNDFIYPKGRKIKVFTFIAKRLYPEKYKFRMRRSSREAYRIAWFHNGDPVNKLMYHDLTPEELGISHPKPTMPIKTFIQRHAIQRMNERLDSIAPGSLLLTIFNSIRKPTIINLSPKKMLIEVHWTKIKVGYFVATLERDSLLIRTFLFLTNNDTPEGELLMNLTGLELLDKQYLAIDKLSTFMSAEVSENSQIREIFDKAACSDLFNEKLQRYSEPSLKHKHTPAAKLSTYLYSSVETPLQPAQPSTRITLTSWLKWIIHFFKKQLHGWHSPYKEQGG